MINKKVQIYYIVLFFLGIVTFLNFVSTPLIKELSVQTQPEIINYGFKIDFLTLIYIDFANAGFEVLGHPFLFLSYISGIWPAFLFAAYYIRKKYRLLIVTSTKDNMLTLSQKINVYEKVWSDLIQKSRLARFADVIYKLTILLTIGVFAVTAFNDGVFEKIDYFFYTFVAMSTVFAAGVVLYHVLIWLALYIIHGTKLLESGVQNKDTKAKSVYYSIIYLLVGGCIWIMLGS
ncbi:MAG: hypothetical protein UZ19_OD1000470 [Parcubacteria bacterium OLB19]|nr:MAG: hypothetical protein UZ19_OD1000470 [Parcubacteria bacterium OLB19]